MRFDRSLPTYEQLFGKIDFRGVDEGRSVYSPAAYLTELLQLLDDNFAETSLTSTDRRSDLTAIVLDTERTFTEVPYLKIVNRVLATLVGPDAHGRLVTDRFPFTTPFEQNLAAIGRYLHHSGVNPEQLYSLFAQDRDPDTVAREFLGISAAEAALVTTVVDTAADGGSALLQTFYGRAENATFDEVTDVEQFLRAARLTTAEWHELLRLEGSPTLDADGARMVSAGPEWFERVNRFLRLARLTGLGLTATDLVLRSCCDNLIDERALRIIAVVVHLHRTLDLPVDVVCSLAAPMDPALFTRVFGAIDLPTVVGDVLAPANEGYRLRVAHAVGLSTADIATVVTRYRLRRPTLETSGRDLLALLHRIGRLTGALGVSVTELFGVLDALDSDPSTRSNRVFGGLIDVEPGTLDHYRMLQAPDPGSALCLLQMLSGVTRWMQATGFDSEGLRAVLGGAAAPAVEGDDEVLTGLREALDQVALTPDVLVSDRFSERAARVLHDSLIAADAVVAGGDPRLLRLAADTPTDSPVASAAFDAVGELVAVTDRDLRGLGLAPGLARKIFTNLVSVGYLDASGMLDPATLPATVDDLWLATDFAAVRDRLYALISGFCAEDDSEEGAQDGPACYPSDLAVFDELTELDQAELYDNLLVHGYLDVSGAILTPEVFTDPDGLGSFQVTVDLDDVAPAVLRELQALAERFRAAKVELDPSIFEEIGLTAEQVVELVDSLRFNGHLDQHGNYVDPAGLAGLTVDRFDLAIQFHPYRGAVLDAVQVQLAEVRAEALTVDEAWFEDIADSATAAAVAAALSSAADGAYIVDELVPDEMRAFFADPENVPDLSGATRALLLTAEAPATVAARMAEILTEQQAYQLDLAAVADLGFDTDETTQLIDLLISEDHLDNVLGVPAHRLAWFAVPSNALAFRLEGLADYSTEIFFLLNAVAAATEDGITEVVDVLVEQADLQRSALVGVLAEALGLPADTVEAICAGVSGGVDAALEALVTPGAAAARTLRRIRRFARLATTLALDATLVEVAFHDQDLAGAFPEPLVLPPDVNRIDAVLEAADGTRYAFRDATVWTYPVDATAASTAPRRLAELSPRLAGLTAVDAAFTDADGTEWIIGHDHTGSHAFVRAAGTTYWTAREQVWGTVRSTFAAPARIDTAFVDDEGRTYLFSGDQYVRYSTSDYTHVDEGYPRAIGEWWEGEDRHTPLPARFRASVDATFQDRDGTTHLFAGDRCLAIGSAIGSAEAVDLPTAEVWGRVRNHLTETGRVDAACVEGAATVLYSGNQVVRYADCLENDGVRVAEGYPCWIETHLRDVPAGFEGALEAVFVAPSGAVHLFKDGRTVTVENGTAGPVVAIPERWGRLPDALTGGHVDSAFVGLDGKTYLFSGERYLRYSGADYSAVDPGYPRTIARDWGGLVRVDASFVLDGATYLFGTRAEGEPQQYVRYSTRNYTTPDAGYPKPLTENWWNLPDGPDAERTFTTVDAVFTGRDNRTYLFSGSRYVVFDNKHRWWSEPRELHRYWDSLPFEAIDAAFVGRDGKTYVFSGERFVRYSDTDHTKLDDRYPAPIRSFWGNVVNTIARQAKVDAALVVDGVTFLFSGDQYVRYSAPDATYVDDGYPRRLDALAQEPRFAHLPPLEGRVRAAFADRRSVHLFVDGRCHVVSDSLYRRYSDLGGGGVGCAFIEDGAVLVEDSGGWKHYSSLEGTTVERTAVRPRTLRRVPEAFRTGLDAVLRGADDNTYLFKGELCFDVGLGRQFPLAQDWGRPRNTVRNDEHVDAAFVGRDGRTYVFSGDQFVVYTGNRVVDAQIDGEPRPVDAHWAGLTSVTLAYVRAGTTYVFEKPDDTGAMRYLVYSGADYARPDPGYPRTADAGFWDVPADLAPEGFTAPDAVLFEGENMLLLTGGQVLRHHEPTATWSPPRPVGRVWPGIDPAAPVTAAFTAPDGATHIFFPGRFTTWSGGTAGPSRAIKEAWGLARNNFLAAGGRVDAAVVDGTGATFLFSGDQYVRYSADRGGDSGYRFVDDGYPKSIATHLRAEESFANLPDTFEYVVAERAATGPVVDAVVANPRTVFLFIGGDCHAVSRTAVATVDVSGLGAVRNVIAERGTVDAALVSEGRTFLFSGDQYVRYSGLDATYVDDGYPRTIEAELPRELGVDALPAALYDGIDAAFRGTDGGTYLFAGPSFVRVDDGAALQPVAGRWGALRNTFTTDPGLDAAFVAPTGELYVFRGDQYARYTGRDLTFVDDGFPRTIRDDWGDLPDTLEDRIDVAFVLDGRTYLGLEDEYVRYSGVGYAAIDRTYPQTFRQRWSGGADYRLEDLRIISRFAELAHAHDGLAEFMAAGPRTVADPYGFLAGAFGWDVEQLRWLVRRRGFLAGAPDERVELELLLKLVDVFAVTDKLGAGPAAVVTDVWSRLHGEEPDLAGAAAALRGMLARKHTGPAWETLSRQIRDELLVLERDALLAVVLARADLPDSRGLFQQLLIDVDMGSRGTTSPVFEAIAATQLFVHRYLLDLEELAVPDGRDPDETRRRVRAWWSWMRNYRTWEVNRKVFLYPENVLRPELRQSKTPAFEALESDLLQGEITAESVQQAYKRYLDEYTEVSRLAIAGGYVFSAAGPADTRDLVLFGRTRTQPRRYYYRRARFRSAEKLVATWEPWLKVDVQIEADEVQPVHAFNRVFVFWTTKESVAPSSTSTTLVTQEQQDGAQEVTAPPVTERVKVHYSFYNLNGEWVPAQTLAMDTRQPGSIFDVDLSVEVADDPESIVVTCAYSVVTQQTDDDGTVTTSMSRQAQATRLSPELVQEAVELLPALTAGPVPGGEIVPVTDPLDEVFTDAEMAAVAAMNVSDVPRVVRFNSPRTSTYGPWFSIDHKGGSFLCRPAAVAPAAEPPSLALRGNGHGLPEWAQIDAAFETPDGTRFFFDNTVGRFVRSVDGVLAAAENTADVWGRVANNLTRTGVVDAVLQREQETFVFSGEQYFRFTGAPFGTPDPTYPRPILGNTDRLPQWRSIGTAFTDLDGTEWFFSADRRTVVQEPDLTRAVANPFGWGPVRAVVVDREQSLTYVSSGTEYVRYTGRDYQRHDGDYPQRLSDNEEGLPRGQRVDAGVRVDGVGFYFDNEAKVYVELRVPPLDAEGPGTTGPGTRRRRRPTERRRDVEELGRAAISGFGTVDAGFVRAGVLYVLSGERYVRYGVDEDTPPALLADGDRLPLPQQVDAVFRRGVHRYVFAGGTYARMRPEQEPSGLTGFAEIETRWGDLPEGFPAEFTGVLDSETDRHLYLFFGPHYRRYPAGVPVPRPFERAAQKVELVRLTTSTAAQLNQRLLAGGVGAMLDPTSQEIDELPAFSTDRTGRNTIQIDPDRVEATRLPAGDHLDFHSANGTYYWEIFFHAPLLIAGALGDAQRFAEARQWYEYVFDPTEPQRYWRFLPFLAVDLAALAERCRTDMAELAAEVTAAELGDTSGITAELQPVLAGLATLAPAFRRNRPLDEDEETVLDALASSQLPVRLADTVAAVDELLTGGSDPARREAGERVVAALRGLQERTALVTGLRRHYDTTGDVTRLVDAYQQDPFDAHAIAELRPVAYRRAVVMAYIDNLLEWADTLFRQYTRESIDEARALYVFAWDLLGARPGDLGPRPLSPTQTYGDLDRSPDLEVLAELAAGGAMLNGEGAVHAGLANSYFAVPANTTISGFWDRVEDRLRKIRQSLNILGISQPLPLFEPPLDPMDLVRGAAAGLNGAAATGAGAAPVPHYRFDATFRRAQELVDKLRQLGNDLLSALDRRDAEELSLLQNRQEGVVLDMTRAIKDAQVRIAETNLRELEAGRTAVTERAAHYKRLLDNGLSAMERAQIGMMSTASALHLTAGLIKVGAGIAYALPQNKIGPFIIGVEWGGKQLGSVLNAAAEIPQVLGEGFSITGELLGVQAGHERSREDWQFQLDTATSDLEQIKHQVSAAEQQVAVAKREAEILAKEITHHGEVATYLKGKFSGAQLYQWMAGQLGGLYFQAYGLAHDMARAAEQAYRFERGVEGLGSSNGSDAFIRPAYWDGRRGGLLAGESLSVDLERLGNAYSERNVRGLEITKRVSLMELNPVALLRLIATGKCDFALTEELFDRDFPGHHRRQIRALAVVFEDVDGNSIEVNATLTQLGHKTVLTADPKAVKHLLDPTEPPPTSVRSDWRANQRIVLSQVGDQENNGLFELRYDDARYLPFEGTGAVSTWQLQLNGRPPADLRGVGLVVRYTAEDGGETFAAAVRGMLKPYPATRYVDVAAEFPLEWAAFVEDGDVLTLPLTPDLFPGMENSLITGVAARYDLDGGAARLLLNGDRALALQEGTVITPPGLRVNRDGAGWTFTVDGPKDALAGVGLILTYRAAP
ncbi:hemopexin repeat-containing protein [Pseudonocardia sp. TRM90224]|uniref:hemopexin repeat-containing protein n=1 Tax=Pseudonocardia sp. TRM90224 TaxID=2812678 RepID=UPI001E408F77|nr:hemopexin repeat-containing protein [Pseudonocardia sp. TRM90224]